MKKFLIGLLGVLTLSIIILAACTNNETQSNNGETANTEQEETVDIYVSAAASMTDVLEEIKEDYEADHNVNIIYTFESSGTLQTQIEEGADCDVFISAALTQMNNLDEGGYIQSDTIKNLLINKVVLITPKDNPAQIDSFEDVATDKVNMIAIGNPESVPVGQYTQTIYENLGLWDDVLAKATLDENVRAVLAHVEGGDVDCGIVYSTDAATSDSIEVICEAPEGTCDTVIYPAAVTKNSQHSEEAKAFLDYLSSDKGVQRLEEAGFTMYEE